MHENVVFKTSTILFRLTVLPTIVVMHFHTDPIDMLSVTQRCFPAFSPTTLLLHPDIKHLAALAYW